MTRELCLIQATEVGNHVLDHWRIWLWLSWEVAQWLIGWLWNVGLGSVIVWEHSPI